MHPADTPPHPVRAKRAEVPEEYHPLTNDQKERAERLLWRFAVTRWHAKEGPKYRILPSVAFIPYPLVTELLDNFHLIRDRAALSQYMLGWQYLNDDGDALYNFVAVSNVKFNEERLQAQSDNDSNARQIETRRLDGLAVGGEGTFFF